MVQDCNGNTWGGNGSSEHMLLEQIYRSVYENSAYGIAVFMPIGRIIALNRRGREILGYGPGDPVEIDVRSYFYGEDEGTIEQELARIALLPEEPGQRQNFSHKCMRMDGTVIWLEGKREIIRLADDSTFVLSTFSNMTEQKQAEEMILEKLEWNKNRRRMLLELYDSIPIGILQQTTSHPAVCVDVNRASIYLLGYEDTPKDFLERGIDFFSCIYLKDRQIMEDIVSRTHMEGSNPFEVRLQLSGGNIRWVNGEVQRLLNLEGEEILQFCFSDNTAQKSMEMALEEERRRNKLIADSTTSVIMEYIVKTDTAYKFRNMRHRDGRISSHHLTIRNMRRRMRENGLIHPEDCARFERCLVNGYGGSLNIRMSSGRNQDYIWYRVQFSSFYEHGVLSRVLCIMDNIQSMMEIQSEKEILTELCHLVVSTKYELIDLIDVEDKTYHYYITEREHWKKISQSGNYNQMLLENIVPLAYDEASADTIRRLTLEQVQERLQTEETVREYVRLQEEDGFRWKLVEFSFLKSDKSRIFQLLSDVHDERISQERLERALEDANKANAAKNDFLANISHEIRTPMNAIIGLSELLLNKNVSRDMEEKLLSIQRAGNGLLEIINGILDFSKIEAGRTQLLEAPYNLTELIAEVTDIMIAQLAQKQVRFFVCRKHDVPVWLNGDALKTRQILMNILGNAVKFTESGYIRLVVDGSMEADGRYQLKLQIADSGRGIRSEDLEWIFEAFGQADERHNRGMTGTGLGLPISRKLAQLMGGDIYAESTFGEGSTFTACVIQKLVTGEKKRNTMKTRKRILVLEPEVELAEELRWHLDNMGAEGQVCSTLEACEQLEQIDLVFLRIRTLQRLFDSGNELPERAKPVLMLEQNELVERDYNEYLQVQIPLFGIQAERLLEQDEQIWGKERSLRRKLYEFIMPEARVLVVDDNEINRMVTEEFLRPYQICTEQAENGHRALQKARQKHFDLVFMDQMMPGIDGVETARRMREISGYQDVPVVALTADATEETRNRFAREGFAGCLIKPVRMDQVEEVLRELLARYIQEIPPDEPVSAQDRESLYPVLLKAYKRDVEAILDELPEAYRCGDRKKFAILAHRLKGASCEVGAGGLEDQAARMEQAAKGDRWPEVTKNFTCFIHNIRCILSDVEEKLQADLKKEKNNVDIAYRDSFDYNSVKELKRACNEARYDDAGKILEELAAFRYDEQDMELLKQMREFSDSLRYDALEQLADDLAEERKKLEVKP